MSSNQSLDRGLAILTLLDRSPEPLGIREIARSMGISPTIVQRLVSTLAVSDFVEQMEETRRYRLGYRAIALGSALRREDRLLSAAHRELGRLADAHHLNGYLGVLRDGEGVYLESIQSSGPISVRILPGSRINLHSTAIGKMLLATLDDTALRAHLAHAPLPALTARTCTDRDALFRQIIEARQKGYAVVREENIEGISSVGALIHDFSGRPLAALSGAFLTSQYSSEALGGVIAHVVEAAHRCAQALGYAGPQPHVDAFQPEALT